MKASSFPEALRLEKPSLRFASSFEALRDACLLAGEDGWTGRNALAHTDVPSFIAVLNRRALGAEIPEGWVPETTFWIVESDNVVGELELRHPLNDYLRRVGGNIGYHTHPQYRNKGIATFALRAGLRILEEMGVREALLTCSEENAASIRVIEKCGGARIEDGIVKGLPPRRRYVIRMPGETPYVQRA